MSDSTVKTLELLRQMPMQSPAISIAEFSHPSHVQGRVVLITGGNAGLGFGAAEHFARLKPARLILSSRSQEKGDKAVEELKRSTGFDGIEARLFDASDFASVQAFADGIVNEIGRLDILVLNAGISTLGKTSLVPAPNGNELLLQTNNLGQELLTFLLLPTMIKTEKENPEGLKPRIVVVSSAAMYMTSLDEDLINHPHMLKRMSEPDYFTNLEVMARRYPDTKLFNVWFAKSLQDRLAASNSSIIVNSLNPGFVLSSFVEKLPEDHQEGFLEVARAKAYTMEEGGRFLLQAALKSAGDAETEDALKGAFFDAGKVTEISEFAKGEVGKKVQEKLWVETVEELSEVDGRVRDIVRSYLS